MKLSFFKRVEIHLNYHSKQLILHLQFYHTKTHSLKFREYLQQLPCYQNVPVSVLSGSQAFTKLQKFVLSDCLPTDQAEAVMKKLYLAQLRKETAALRSKQSLQQIKDEIQHNAESIEKHEAVPPSINEQQTALAASVFFGGMAQKMVEMQQQADQTDGQLTDVLHMLEKTRPFSFCSAAISVESATIPEQNELTPLTASYKDVAKLVIDSQQQQADVQFFAKKALSFDRVKYAKRPEVFHDQEEELRKSQVAVFGTQQLEVEPSNLIELVTFKECDLQAVPPDQQLKFIQFYKDRLIRVNNYARIQVNLQIDNSQTIQRLDETARELELQINVQLKEMKRRLKGFDEKKRLCDGLIQQFQSNGLVLDIQMTGQKLGFTAGELTKKTTMLGKIEPDFKTLLQERAEYSAVNTQEYLANAAEYFTNKAQWRRVFGCALERGIENCSGILRGKVAGVEKKQKSEVDNLVRLQRLKSIVSTVQFPAIAPAYVMASDFDPQEPRPVENVMEALTQKYGLQ